MREVLVTSSILLAIGCLLLAGGLTAITVSPQGLGFFAKAEVTKGWPYEFLQVSGFILTILGGITALIGAVAFTLGLSGLSSKHD